MSRTSPFLIMKVAERCSHCGLVVAVSGTDIFHQSPVCQQFHTEMMAAGATSDGIEQNATSIDANGVSVNTNPAHGTN